MIHATDQRGGRRRGRREDRGRARATAAGTTATPVRRLEVEPAGRAKLHATTVELETVAAPDQQVERRGRGTAGRPDTASRGRTGETGFRTRAGSAQADDRRPGARWQQRGAMSRKDRDERGDRSGRGGREGRSGDRHARG